MTDSQALRQKFAGAVPLAKQEQFTKTLFELQEDKVKIEKNLHEVNLAVVLVLILYMYAYCARYCTIMK